jgi:hypothetical protein
MNNLNGIYTGIVIDSSGKSRTGGDRSIGQVLVKINGVTPSRSNESYKAVPASNVEGEMDLDLALGSEVLAYVLSPITGESSQGIYNSSKNETSPTRSVASKQFTLMHKKLRDSHCDGPKKNLTPINNPYGNNYFPNYPWNAGLGSYGIPEVNSRVVIGFLKGYRSFPIVLGKLNTPDEQESFYKRGRVYGGAPSNAQNYNASGKPGTGTGTAGTTKDATANTGDDKYPITQSELDEMAARGTGYYESPSLKYSDGTPVKYSNDDPAGIKHDPDISPVTKFLMGKN